ncbi:hypothetical protein [Polaromonas sp. YR568]|uniref:hypothetical protein n=1 Tax=Polaromonas sp. YR568 TaxID=1855301 RepID=UPI00398C150A
MPSNKFRLGRALSFLLAVAIVTSLPGCDFSESSKASAASMSKEAIATREAPPELVFKGQLAEKPAYLLVYDCEVFQVELLKDGGVKWTRVLEPDFYPMWTMCVRQSLKVNAGVVTVELGRQAFGAGGCCASGGVYRSVDGVNWKQATSW